MNKNKTFVTLFPRCKNIELLKDVGMIPYHMYKCYGYDSSVACYGDDEYNYLNSEVSGLKLIKIPRIYNSVVKDGCSFIKKNAKNIDVLNVYHLIYSESFQWIKLYKRLNPSGKVYLKMDLDYMGLKKHTCDNLVKRILKRNILKKCDLISAESISICKSLYELYKIKVEHIPNGVCKINTTYVHGKNNVFLTVGRLGTVQKATEVLLEAFAKAATKTNWTLRLVGPIEDSFIPWLNNFMNVNRDIVDRIQFVGSLTDRDALNKEYENAKVFVLTSRWEGYPLALAEAQTSGCYVILSDKIPPAIEAISIGNEDSNNKENNAIVGEGGVIFENENNTMLSEIMIKVSQIDNWDEKADKIKKYADEYNNWERICMKIEEALR